MFEFKFTLCVYRGECMTCTNLGLLDGGELLVECCACESVFFHCRVIPPFCFFGTTFILSICSVLGEIFKRRHVSPSSCDSSSPGYSEVGVLVSLPLCLAEKQRRPPLTRRWLLRVATMSVTSARTLVEGAIYKNNFHCTNSRVRVNMETGRKGSIVIRGH